MTASTIPSSLVGALAAVVLGLLLVAASQVDPAAAAAAPASDPARTPASAPASAPASDPARTPASAAAAAFAPSAQDASMAGPEGSGGFGAAQREQVVAEALAFLSHYNDTLYGDDEAAIRGLFVADDRFAWFTDGASSYGSADDVLSSLGQYAGMSFETELSSKEVTPLTPSLAAVSTVFHTTLTIPGADDYVFGGVITWLLERSPDSGAWQVLRGHTSTPGGPPGGQAGR